MRTISSTQAQKSFGELVTNAIKEPISITKHAKEVFVIVPSDEYHKMKQAYENASGRLFVAEDNIAQSYLGSVKGVFSSSAEVDQFIAKEREAWG